MPEETIENQVRDLRLKFEQSERRLSSLTGIERDVADLKLMVQGNPQLGIKGMAATLVSTNEALEKVLEDKKQNQSTIRGIQLGLGLALASGATQFAPLLLPFLKALTGGQP